MKLRSIRSLRKGRKRKGLLFKSRFTELKSFKGVSFYGLDIMHLVGQGLAKHFWILVSTNKYGATNRNPFFIKPLARRHIGKAMAELKRSLPSSLTTCTTDISRKKLKKSIDWIDFLRYMVPTILIEHIQNRHAKEATKALSNIFKMLFHRTITETSLRELNINVWKWLNYLRRQFEQGNIKETIFTITQHYLVHLVDMIRAMGPPRMYSAFAMERALGEVKKKVRSKSAQGTEAGNIMVKLAAKRHADQLKVPAEKVKEVLTDSQASNAPEIWSPFWNSSVDEYPEFGLDRLLRSFWSIYIDDLGPLNTAFEAGSRLWLSQFEIIGSAYRPRNESRRDDFLAKMTIDIDQTRYAEPSRNGKVYFGEVIFYFRSKQQGMTKLLALVKAWETKLTTSGEMKAIREALEGQTAITTRLLKVLENFEFNNRANDEVAPTWRCLRKPKRLVFSKAKNRMVKRSVQFNWNHFRDIITNYRVKANLPALPDGEIEARSEHAKSVYPTVILEIKAEHHLRDEAKWSDPSVKVWRKQMFMGCTATTCKTLGKYAGHARSSNERAQDLGSVEEPIRGEDYYPEPDLEQDEGGQGVDNHHNFGDDLYTGTTQGNATQTEIRENATLGYAIGEDDNNRYNGNSSVGQAGISSNNDSDVSSTKSESTDVSDGSTDDSDEDSATDSDEDSAMDSDDSNDTDSDDASSSCSCSIHEESQEENEELVLSRSKRATKQGVKRNYVDTGTVKEVVKRPNKSKELVIAAAPPRRSTRVNNLRK
ncbi:hypothetical protein BJV82DRAFT_675807 [Fennellomyces sp. T-0311]|nr:hypothetical protein BJV82DRAFT_675807 [Fennellomyces sp. T-0311]